MGGGLVGKRGIMVVGIREGDRRGKNYRSSLYTYIKFPKNKKRLKIFTRKTF